MRYYPLLLNLQNVRVLVAGAGEVGHRKATDVLICEPAELLLVDPHQSRDTLPANLLEAPNLRFEQRDVTGEDVKGKGLVFAATGCRATNAMLAKACHEAGIFCNVIDAPTDGDFIVPAHFRKGDFLLALATGGYSPALAKRLRMELQEWVGTRYSPLLTVMGRVRPLVLALGSETKDNSAVFRQLVYSGLATALADGNKKQATKILRSVLPKPLHKHIGDILHDPL